MGGVLSLISKWVEPQDLKSLSDLVKRKVDDFAAAEQAIKNEKLSIKADSKAMKRSLKSFVQKAKKI
jgi:hypothetical protein